MFVSDSIYWRVEEDATAEVGVAPLSEWSFLSEVGLGRLVDALVPTHYKTVG